MVCPTSPAARVLWQESVAGFELPVPHVALLSLRADARGGLSLSARSPLRKKKSKNTKSILSYAELEVGDYVVHESYGIGQYTGIEAPQDRSKRKEDEWITLS